MRYCSKCGSPIPDGAAFCGNCGAPAAPQKPAAPGKPAAAATAVAVKSKTPLIIGAAAAAVVVVLAVVLISVFAGRSHSGPAQQFISYQQQLLSQVTAPVQSAGDTAKKGVKTDVTISASVDSPVINAFLNGTSLTMKMDASQDRALINEQISMMGSAVLNATITYEDGKLGVYLPELDENYYVVDLTDIFAALQDEFGNYLDHIPGGDAINPFPAVATLLSSGEAGDIVRALRPYLNTLLTLVNDQSVTKEENVSVTLSSVPAPVSCTVYTFSPRAEDVENMLTALAGQLEKDKDLRSALGGFYSYVLELAPSMLEGAPSDSPDQIADEELKQAAQDIRDSAANIAQEYDRQLDLTWTLAVEGDEIRQIAVDVTDLTTYQNGGLVYESADQADGQHGQFLYMAENGDTMPLLSVLTGEADGRHSGTITLNAGRDTIVIGYDTQPDKKSPLGVAYGEYSLFTQRMPVELAFTVADGADGGTDHTVTITGDSAMFGGYFSELSVTMNVTDGTSAVWPDAAPVDISDYTPDQFEQLLGSFVNAMDNDVLGNLDALFGDAW